MARFQVHRLRDERILLLDLQSDALEMLKTRVVAPLVPVEDMSWTIGQMNPRFEIAGATYVLAPQRMAAVSLLELGPVIADLSAQRDRIVAATDFLFQGF